jgi:hypothetical protein
MWIINQAMGQIGLHCCKYSLTSNTHKNNSKQTPFLLVRKRVYRLNDRRWWAHFTATFCG